MQRHNSPKKLICHQFCPFIIAPCGHLNSDFLRNTKTHRNTEIGSKNNVKIMFSYYILPVLAVLSPRNMGKLADKWQETLERQLWQLFPLFSPSTCQVFSERQLEGRTHCEKYPMVLPICTSLSLDEQLLLPKTELQSLKRTVHTFCGLPEMNVVSPNF